MKRELGTTRKTIFLLPFLLAACTLDTYGSIPSGTNPGSGGSGASGGAGGTGGAGGSGGGQTGTEDCTNGIDDDGDGDADCADSDCNAGYVCVPTTPAGWEAVWILEQPYSAEVVPPNCPDGSAPAVRFAEPATTTTCAECTCDYSGTTCTGPGFAWAQYNSSCTPLNNTIWTDGSGCFNLSPVDNNSNSSGSARITAPAKVAAGSTCTGGASSVVGDMWGKQVFVCAVPSVEAAGCAGSEACVPTSSGSFAGAKACITIQGSSGCPMGYPEEHSVFDDGTDERSCGDCGCDPSTVTCEGGGYVLYDDNGCKQGNSGPFTLTDSCKSVSGIFDWNEASVMATAGTPTGGTCTPAQPGGGAIVTSGARTICCVP